jgi:hypothetical protein
LEKTKLIGEMMIPQEPEGDRHFGERRGALFNEHIVVRMGSLNRTLNGATDPTHGGKEE